MGSLKSVNPNAGQTIVIRGLTSVVDKHIDDVAKYYGLAIPIRNFNKVYNVKTSNYVDVDIESTSVKKVLEEKWGTYASDIIESTLSDLQTSRTPKEYSNDMLNQMFGIVQQGFVQATLAGNISVTIKQAASYPTAGAVLSTKSLIAGVKGFTAGQKLYDEIDVHTGTHYKRRIGLSTQEIGDLTREHALMTKLPTAVNPMKWIQSVDVQTTAALWVASKAEIESENPNLKVGSEEYWNKVTELYDYVIETTQPNYDVLHRPEVQKTNNKLVKSVVMFKTQPLQNTGILYDSLFDMQQQHKLYNADSSQKNKNAFDKSKKIFVKAVTSQLVSAIVFASMSLVASAIKHSMSAYRDDDKDVTKESVAKGLLNSVASVLSSDILPIGGGEIYEIITNKVLGNSSYDIVSVPVVSTINDFIDSGSDLLTTTKDVITGNATAKDEFNAVKDTALQVATVLGIPASNIYDYTKGAIANIHDMVNGEFGEFSYGVDKATSVLYKQLYQATMNGDDSQIEKIKSQLEDKGVDESAIISGLRSALIKYDSRVAQAGIAYASGDIDEFYNLRTEIISSGFDETDVVKAIKSYATKLENAKSKLIEGDEDGYNQALETLLSSGYDKDTILNAIDNLKLSDNDDTDSVSQIYSTDDLVTALDSKDYTVAKNMVSSIIDIKVQNGKTEEEAEKALKSTLTTQYKQNYIDGSNSERNSIESKLKATGLFTDDDYTEWVASSYNTEALTEALESGYESTQTYVKERVDAKVANGSTEEDAKKGIKQSIGNLYKQEFINGDANTRAKIITYMTNTGLYASRTDVITYTNKRWLK
jgi:hypothetical protein